jgi:hypothetical protein
VLAGTAGKADEALDAVVEGCCEKADDETRRARRRAEIAERDFMAGETIGRTPTRQAATGPA